MAEVEEKGPDFDKIANESFEGKFTAAQLKTKFT